jgi:superfamily II DNA helicase RecQ
MVSILLKLDQNVSAFSVLPSIDVLALFPTGLGKSIIYQLFVTPKSRLIIDINKKAVAFVISPLKSIFGDQLKYFNFDA